jgi:hypothetical protein
MKVGYYLSQGLIAQLFAARTTNITELTTKKPEPNLSRKQAT